MTLDTREVLKLAVMESVQPNTQDNAQAEDKPRQFNDLLLQAVDKFQNFTIFLGGISSVIATAGIAVVNSHLYRYTTVHSFDIGVGRYLAAGILLSLFFAALLGIYIICERTLRFIDDRVFPSVSFTDKRGWRIAGGVAFSIGTLVLAYLITRQFYSLLLIALVLVGIGLREHVKAGLSNPFTNKGLAVFVGFILIAMLGGLAFGQSIYRQIPRALGGGLPPEVQLIFHDPANVQLTGLAPATPGSNTTTLLCLLSEMHDSMLVYDPDTRRSITIQQGLLIGITDQRAYADDAASAARCVPPWIRDNVEIFVDDLTMNPTTP